MPSPGSHVMDFLGGGCFHVSLASFGRQRSAVDISFPRHQLVPQCFGSNYECSAVRVLGDVDPKTPFPSSSSKTLRSKDRLTVTP